MRDVANPVPVAGPNTTARPNRMATLPLTLRLYRAAGYLAEPFAPLLLARRLKRGKEDAARLDERLGKPALARPEGIVVWLHAASVGETISILPLAERLVAAGRAVLVTSGTLTSATLAASWLPQGAFHQFVPLDTPRAARRFVAHWRPDLAVFCESELWPTLMVETLRRGIPLGLVNGRMSVRSARRWGRLPRTARALLAPLTFCLAQSEADAVRLAALGAPAQASGNLKFDSRPLPVDGDQLLALERAIGQRPVLLAASTHAGEEALILEAAARIREEEPELLTIIVPRHPSRGPEIAALAAAGGMRPALSSRGDAPDDLSVLFIADTLGELGLYYSLASVAFIGGSLVPVGGHNPIEPARLGAPIVHGPGTANFRDIYTAFDAAGAAIAVDGAESLARATLALVRDPAARTALVDCAKALVMANEGALDATLRAMDGALAPMQGPAR